MRLCERGLLWAQIAPRIRQVDDLGGVSERFSEERIPVRVSVLPEGGEIAVDERGASARERLRLLAAADVQAQAGDGVWVQEKLWRICSVERWSAHRELVCEAV